MVFLPFPVPTVTALTLLIEPRSPRSSAGTYGTGPLHGKLIDARGPRLSLATAFIALSIGYLGTKMIFDTGLTEGQERASTAAVTLLVICGFLTGGGSAGGGASSLNTVAKSFPEHLVSDPDLPTPYPFRLLDCHV